MTLQEFMTLAEIFATMIFAVKLLHDCIRRAGIFLSNEQQSDTISLFGMGLYAISVKKIVR